MNFFVALLVAITFQGQIETGVRAGPDGSVMKFKSKAECEAQVALDRPDLKSVLDGKVASWELSCIPEAEYNKLK